MRWYWIDRFVEFQSRKLAVAVKNVTMAEEHMHDLYPAFPVMPASIIVEGMAQTAGMLVGEARNFEEKVILAKITRATFYRLVRPGDTVVYRATVEQMSDAGASIAGSVVVRSYDRRKPAPGQADVLPHAFCDHPVADIELMFSHIDQNLAGLEFPEHNFVFTREFTDLLNAFRMQTNVSL